MTLIQFLKKYKIDDILSFHKEELNSRITIGWKSSDSLDMSKEIVLSRSRFDNKKQRITAANFSEYYKYFIAITQKTPQQYLESDISKPIINEIDPDFVKSLAIFLSSKEKLAWKKMVTLEILDLKE